MPAGHEAMRPQPRQDALFAALRNRADNGAQTLIYELPEVEVPSFLRGCVQGWSKAH
jgi:hypothetical protein